jgi:hypothetical protein
MGIGLPEEDTWAHIVSKFLGLKNFNLSLGGGSNDSCFRMAYHWIPQLKPKIVVMLVVEPSRLEVIDGDNIVHQYIGSWHDPNRNSSKDELWNRWRMNDINGNMNAIKNTMAIQNLCDTYGIKLVKAPIKITGPFDRARDLAHPGVETNKDFAAKFLNMM